MKSLPLFLSFIIFTILSCTEDDSCNIPNQENKPLASYQLEFKEISETTFPGEYIIYQVDDHPFVVYNEDLNFYTNRIITYGSLPSEVYFRMDIHPDSLNIPQNYIRFLFSDINGDSGQPRPIDDEMTYLITTWDYDAEIVEAIFWGTYDV